jgi:tetratricopeptide (TPR) repeat protein
MNSRLFRSPRFWILALIAVAAIGLAAYAFVSDPSADAPPRRLPTPGVDGRIPPPPEGMPLPGPEAKAAEALDGLVMRGARYLDEKSFNLAAEAFGQALEGSRAAGDRGRLVRAALGRAEALARQGNEAEALKAATAVRKELPTGPPPTEEDLRLAALEAALLGSLGRPLEAAPVAREALNDADRHHPGDGALRDLLVSALADALVATGGVAEAVKLIDEHLSKPEIAAMLAPGKRAGWMDRAGRLYGVLGEFALSVERLESSLDARVAAGGDDPVPAAVTRISLAASLFDVGQPDRARAEATKAHEVLSEKLPPDDPDRLRLAEIAARIGVELTGP